MKRFLIGLPVLVAILASVVAVLAALGKALDWLFCRDLSCRAPTVALPFVGLVGLGMMIAVGAALYFVGAVAYSIGEAITGRD